MERKNYITLLFFLSLLLIGSFLNVKYKVFPICPNARSEGSNKVFSVMSFNINALDTLYFSNERQSQLLNLIESLPPSILCVQELSDANFKKISTTLDSIYGICSFMDIAKESNRYRLFSNFPIRNFSKYKCCGHINTAGFDSLSLVDYQNRLIQMPMMSAEFEIEPGRWVTVFSGHLRSSAYSTARRSMGMDSNWWDGLSLYWKNYKIGKRIRDYEARNVRRFIDVARSEGKPVIVAGDLNDWCGSDCLDILMGDDLKDAWSEGGNGFGWTYFGWHLRLRLDHILYSDELELTDVKVLDTDLSDHKPLMAKFRLK